MIRYGISTYFYQMHIGILEIRILSGYRILYTIFNLLSRLLMVACTLLFVTMIPQTYFMHGDLAISDDSYA